MKNIDELIAKLESYEDYDGFNDDLVVALREQRDEIARLTTDLSVAHKWQEESRIYDAWHEAASRCAAMERRAERAEAERDRTQSVLEETVASMGESIIRIEAERDAMKLQLNLRPTIKMDQCETYCETAIKLVAERDAAMKDAERYRHVRNLMRIGQHGEWIAIPGDAHWAEHIKDQFDAAIDAAMKGKL